ncbi:MAG TPA: glycosyltransferase family 2 protein [Symbiobacteriaceae bacterium]
MHVAAVIPAYNEETTIAEIVRVLRQCDEVSEIIVVDDGSGDRTAERAQAAGARVVGHPYNLGKAGALKTGVQSTQAPVLLFLDADLIGLSPAHVRALLRPVLDGQADMTVGIFDDGRVATDLAQMVAPYLSGQRALRREIMEELFRVEPHADLAGYGIEVALTRHVRDRGYRVVEVPLEEMSHRMKEEKLGLVKGVRARLKMYYEILKYAQKG